MDMEAEHPEKIDIMNEYTKLVSPLVVYDRKRIVYESFHHYGPKIKQFKVGRKI